MGLKQSMKDIFFCPVCSILYALFFITPLVISSNTNELFEFPKMFFVYSCVIVLSAIFLTGLVLKKKKIRFPGKAVLFLVCSSLISTILSSHPYTSFWGYYTRFNDGLLSLLVYLSVYFVLINTFEQIQFVRLMKIVAMTVFPVGLIGIFQHFGFSSNPIDRVYSTFGQPNWLAQYLSMLLPYILYLFLTESLFFWAVLFVIGFSCLWFTYSTSGILAFVLAAILMTVLLALKKVLNRKSSVKLVSLCMVCLIIALANPGLFKDKLEDALKDLNNIVSIERIYAQEEGYKVSDPGFIRFELWKGTFDLILSSYKVFLVGTGLETFPYVFQTFRPINLNFSSEWEFVFNKPHNYYLEIFAETGLLGFLSYIVLLFKVAKKLPYYVLPGLAGFAVSNIFGWPVVPTALLFWFWAAWAEVS